jgi:hypothetical protein
MWYGTSCLSFGNLDAVPSFGGVNELSLNCHRRRGVWSTTHLIVNAGDAPEDAHKAVRIVPIQRVAVVQPGQEIQFYKLPCPPIFTRMIYQLLYFDKIVEKHNVTEDISGKEANRGFFKGINAEFLILKSTPPPIFTFLSQSRVKNYKKREKV